MHPVIISMLRLNAITTPSIWSLAYLIKTFVLFRITNPLQWLIDLPTYSPDNRGLIILFYICYQIVIWAICQSKYDDYLKEQQKNNQTP
jgi:energy-coupling factor transporter transmembrane protein EcfT